MLDGSPHSMMPSAPAVHLSVIIPAYNEELRLIETLRQSVEYLSGQDYDAEIVVVDDGSVDATASLVRAWATKAPVRLIAHDDGANHGKGAAVRLGMLAARGDYRLFMDADNSTTLDQVAGFWPAVEQGFDVVIGSRSIAGSRVSKHQSRPKEIAGRIGNRIIQTFAVPGISDTQAGFKLFSCRCAEAVFPLQTVSSWGFDIEILAISRFLGYAIKELPIVWVNAAGSKVRFTTYFEVLKEVLTVRRNLRTGLYVPGSAESRLPSQPAPISK